MILKSAEKPPVSPSGKKGEAGIGVGELGADSADNDRQLDAKVETQAIAVRTCHRSDFTSSGQKKYAGFDILFSGTNLQNPNILKSWKCAPTKHCNPSVKDKRIIPTI